MSISTLALTSYVLVWPALVAVVMAVIGQAFFKEWKDARDSGQVIV